MRRIPTLVLFFFVCACGLAQPKPDTVATDLATISDTTNIIAGTRLFIDSSDALTPEQALATRERHFAGVTGLWQVWLDADALGEQLLWEPSRGGALFPHLYRPLIRADIVSTRQID